MWRRAEDEVEAEEDEQDRTGVPDGDGYRLRR